MTSEMISYLFNVAVVVAVEMAHIGAILEIEEKLTVEKSIKSRSGLIT